MTLRMFCCIRPTNPTVFGFTANEFLRGLAHHVHDDRWIRLRARQSVMEEVHNFNSSDRIDCVVRHAPALEVAGDLMAR